MTLRASLALLLLPLAGWAQTVCPSVNFRIPRSVNLKPAADSHVNLVRQPDGSYTGFELTDAPPHRLIATTPHFERQFAACLPRAIPAPAAPVSAPKGGISSQLAASELLPSGNLFVASIGAPYGSGAAPLQFDLYAPDGSSFEEATFTDSNGGVFVSLALADVNADGKQDLIALSLDQSPAGGDSFLRAGYLWVFLGNGDGTFRTGVSFLLPGSFLYPGYSSFAVADLNGDGKPDLAFATGSGVTTIALGNGDGTFSILPSSAVANLATSIANPYLTGSIAAADLNADGKPDLVLGPFHPSNTPAGTTAIAVALGNGNGTFQTPVFYAARINSSNGVNQLAIGDMNQDGIPDIVTAGGTIFFGDGKGGFPTRRDYLSNAAGSVTLADFDGDGNPDILVGNGNSLFASGIPAYPTLTVIFGAGGGAFLGAPISFPTTQASTPLAADFNGDGKPDLVFNDSQGRFIDIATGAGDGTFTLTYQYSTNAPDLPPVAFAAADFNRDGKQDLAALTFVPNEGESAGVVEIFLGNGDGTLRAPLALPLPAPNPTAIGIADFNGDGIPDLAATAQGGVWVWLGKGDGSFSAPSTIAFPQAFLSSLAIGDFNGDGKPDLAVANPGAESIAILLGKGDGTFSPPAAVPLSTRGPSTQTQLGPYALTVSDFNDDSKLDLAATFGSPNGPGGAGIAVLLGNGDGTFQPLAIDPEAALSIQAADINGDSIPDLVLDDETLGTAVRLGNADGTFQPPVPLTSPPASGFTIADFNGDGKPDIAIGLSVINSAPSGIAVLLNLSTPPPALTVVSAASFIEGPLAPNEIASAFGRDLAVGVNSGATQVTVQDSAGNTRLAPFVYYSAPTQVNFVVPPATADGPARVDIISADGHQTSAEVQIAPVAPALSTVGGAGIAAAYAIRVNPDLTQTILPVFTVQGSSIAATPLDLSQPGQVYLLLFGTGFDLATAATTAVTIQGVPVPVQYAGPQESFTGFDQIGVLLPPSLQGAGVATVEVTIAGILANPVSVAIQ